jgi:DNA-binding beta-propeller fold protein YncE
MPLRRVLLALALASACGSPERRDDVVYAPLEGAAFPRDELRMPAGDLGVTSDVGSDTLTLLDLSGGVPIAALPAGRNPVDNDGPRHVVVDRARRSAYVALSYPPIDAGPHSTVSAPRVSGFLQRISLEDGTSAGAVLLDPNPADVALSDDGAVLAVTHFDITKVLDASAPVEQRRAMVAFLEPDEIRPVGSSEPAWVRACLGPQGIALSPDGAIAYVACYGEDAVAIVDRAHPGRAVTRVPVGADAGSPGHPTCGPYGLARDHAGTKVALSQALSKDVRVLDIAKGTFDDVLIATDGVPVYAAYSEDDAVLFIPTRGPDALVRADAATGAIFAERALDDIGCVSPHAAAIGAGGAKVYVVCEGDGVARGRVVSLDAATLEPDLALEVGVTPDRLAVAAPP